MPSARCPFNAGWGAIQKWDTEQWQEEVDLERLMRERGMSGGEEAPPDEIVSPDIEYGNEGDIDPCCKRAIEVYRAGLPFNSGITLDLVQQPQYGCDWLRAELEDLASTDIEKYPDNPHADYGPTWDATMAASAKNALKAWNECHAESFKESGDFTASADPFEAGWDAVLKGVC